MSDKNNLEKDKGLYLQNLYWYNYDITDTYHVATQATQDMPNGWPMESLIYYSL